MSSKFEHLRRGPGDLVWLRDDGRLTALKVLEISRENPGPDLAFFAPEYDLGRSPACWFRGEVLETLPKLKSTLPAIRFVRPPDEASFTRQHKEVMEAIARGKLKKLVPFVVEELAFESPLDWTMFSAGFEDRPGCYSFGMQVGEQGMCGFTPEILFRVRGEELTTMALAGTRAAEGPSLLEDPKEKHEHDLVIEDISQRLAGLGLMEVDETCEIPFGKLKHLRTEIRVSLNSKPSMQDLVSRLHPTAALGGYPKSQAQPKLAKWGRHRGRFGAPFGWQKGDEMMCVVAIRGVHWSGPKAQVFSGCGVVAGSRSEREWGELALKRESTKANLGIPE
ncbi:MAG: chorismate-binding protein [Bdellovibrionales bacterium]